MFANRAFSAGRAAMVALATCGSVTTWAGTEGTSSTFYGVQAGSMAPAASGANTLIGVSAGAQVTDGTGNTIVGAGAGTLLNADGNTFLGAAAGLNATSGNDNTFLGRSAGILTTTGASNTYLGRSAGGLNLSGARNVAVGYLAGYENEDGSANLFLGNRAGQTSAGSNRLYIDNCFLVGTEGTCSRPLLYGEFDNRLLDVDGVVHVTAHRLDARVKSQLHFSVTGSDTGGWMTSAADNNFFTSSGARYDADAGGWIQRSPDGKAVISGSGAAGFRVLTSSGGSVGNVVFPIDRLHIDYNGLLGVNISAAAGRAINTSTGAYLSSGGVWTNASSRALKKDIRDLPAAEAMAAFEKLTPVQFSYKDEDGAHVGFIAEDVPELVATGDRKGLSAMDVVAVLTKVVQQQAAELSEMKERLRRLESR